MPLVEDGDGALHVGLVVADNGDGVELAAGVQLEERDSRAGPARVLDGVLGA